MNATGFETPAGPIVVCIPRLDPHDKHLEHWQEFYAANKARYDLRPLITYNKAPHRAQQQAVNLARRIGATHILFTESDQWGYPLDGLDVLLEADKDVIGFRTYSHRYPYGTLNFRKQRPEHSLLLHPKDQRRLDAKVEWFGKEKDGPDIVKCDLLSWAFTLVKMSVFHKMRKAWGHVTISQKDLESLIYGITDGDLDAADIVANRLRHYTEKPRGLEPFIQWGPHPTDSFFCQYCEEIGVDVFVHFGATIGHADIGPEDLLVKRKMDETRRMPAIPAGHPDMYVVEDDGGHPYGPPSEHRAESQRITSPVDYNNPPTQELKDERQIWKESQEDVGGSLSPDSPEELGRKVHEAIVGSEDRR